MKHTPLTTKEDRRERLLFAAWIIAFFIIAGLISSLAVSCNASKNNDPLLKAGTQAQKDRFLECSQYEGDQGCDSCYYLVYGKHSGF